MPGDRNECREHADRCWALASEAKNPFVKASLNEVAAQLAGVARELEATRRFLEGFDVTSDGLPDR